MAHHLFHGNHLEDKMKKIDVLLLDDSLRGSLARILIVMLSLAGIYFLPELMSFVGFVCPVCNVNYLPSRHLALFFSACAFASIIVCVELVRVLFKVARKINASKKK